MAGVDTPHLSRRRRVQIRPHHSSDREPCRCRLVLLPPNPEIRGRLLRGGARRHRLLDAIRVAAPRQSPRPRFGVASRRSRRGAAPLSPQRVHAQPGCPARRKQRGRRSRPQDQSPRLPQGVQRSGGLTPRPCRPRRHMPASHPVFGCLLPAHEERTAGVSLRLPQTAPAEHSSHDSSHDRRRRTDTTDCTKRRHGQQLQPRAAVCVACQRRHAAHRVAPQSHPVLHQVRHQE